MNRIYRLSPLADQSDPSWEVHPPCGVVLVRAKSSGEARVLAATAARPKVPTPHQDNDDVYSVNASALISEKLYGVHAVADSGYAEEGETGVLEIADWDWNSGAAGHSAEPPTYAKEKQT